MLLSVSVGPTVLAYTGVFVISAAPTIFQKDSPRPWQIGPTHLISNDANKKYQHRQTQHVDILSQDRLCYVGNVALQVPT